MSVRLCQGGRPVTQASVQYILMREACATKSQKRYAILLRVVLL